MEAIIMSLKENKQRLKEMRLKYEKKDMHGLEDKLQRRNRHFKIRRPNLSYQRLFENLRKQVYNDENRDKVRLAHRDWWQRKLMQDPTYREWARLQQHVYSLGYSPTRDFEYLRNKMLDALSELCAIDPQGRPYYLKWQQELLSLELFDLEKFKLNYDELNNILAAFTPQPEESKKGAVGVYMHSCGDKVPEDGV